VRRSRQDFAGLGRFARQRDREIILHELKADEEPEYLPIRKRAEPAPPPVQTPREYTGYEFIDELRNYEERIRVPRNIQSLWRDVEFGLDFDNLAAGGYMLVAPDGAIRVQPYAKAAFATWMFFATHLIYHLALGLVEPPPDHPDRNLWILAAEIIVNRYAASTLFMPPPDKFPRDQSNLPQGSSLLRRIATLGNAQAKPAETPDEQIAQWRRTPNRLPVLHDWYSPAGLMRWDVVNLPPATARRFRSIYLLDQVRQLEVRTSKRNPFGNPEIERAYRWVENHFPLLSAVTSQFEIDYTHAREYNITIGAVSARDHVIFVNPDAGLSELEWRWVLIHEILHVVLEHQQRLGQRDRLLWNVACDYVINNWLEQMGVGMRPQGVLFKPDYQGRDAESIYDELLRNGGNDQIRLVTLRGMGIGDIMDFDEGYRYSPARFRGHNNHATRQIVQHSARQILDDELNGLGRGNIPGDLIEELALGEYLKEQVEVPPWKAELAHWLNVQLAPRAPRRSYMRLNRRQSAAPDIPLAGKANLDYHSPTFGVVLDTSGSMSHRLLQQGLSAVVAFAERNGVSQIRLIMCDTRPFDEGFIPLRTLRRPYHIRGRGGTILQPAIDLLLQADDFPDDAPILIVTDGQIDVLTVRREHAYLLPGRGTLPFEPDGPVFNILDGHGGGVRRTPPSQQNQDDDLADWQPPDAAS
jgi:predicted metal-dependent peptidase